MEYLVIGAGGTGGCIAGMLANAGKDVTLLARGAHLAAMKENGLQLHSAKFGDLHIPIKAVSQEEYSGQPDVIFVCVKAYSLTEIIDFVSSVSTAKTMVIPILNCYGTGKWLAERISDATILDGCIYIWANKAGPGEICHIGDTFRIVFGALPGTTPAAAVLENIKQDLLDAGIDAQVSANIQRDIMRKMSTICAFAGAGAYYSARAGEIYQTPEIREMYLALVAEVAAIAAAMGINIGEDAVAVNLKALEKSDPQAMSSLQRDLEKGGQSEIDTLLFEMVRLGEQFGVDTPQFSRVAEKFGYQPEGLC